MKFKKLITLASLVSLITFLLPVVSSGNQSVAPVSEHVVDYLNAPSLLMLFIVWYGAFVLILLLSLSIVNRRVIAIFQSLVIILLSVFSLFIHFTFLKELVGRSQLGYGAILYFICALINIFAAFMVMKGSKGSSR